jgi:predicted transcriptional regulator
LASLNSLLRLVGTGVRGPSPSFGEAHLLLAYLTIGDTGSIGRQALAKNSNLGEGAIRTVLKKLRDEGYADADASGCHLTETGNRLYRSIRKTLSSFVSIACSQLTIGSSQVALVVRGGGAGVRDGIEQRDYAIRVGASGATTYSIRTGRFTIPGGSSNCEKDFPSGEWSVLRKGLGPRNGDAVVLCGAKDETTAKLGALAAAVTLL